MTFKGEWNICITRTDGDPRNENNSSLVFSRCNLSFNEVLCKSTNDEACSIAKTVFGVEVLEKHDDTSYFKPEMMKKFELEYGCKNCCEYEHDNCEI